MNDMPRRDDGTPENEAGSTANGGHDGDGGVSDESVDRFLRSSGAELRDSAPAMDGNQLVVRRLESRLRRSRRNGVIAVGVAAALLAATVGFVVTDTDPAEIAAGGEGALAPGSPEAIVAALPPEPVDPHDVDLVASVRRFDDCDTLAADLRAVGAAHVGSRGFGGTAVDGMSPDVVLPSTGGDADLATVTGEALPIGDETLGTNVIVGGVDEPDRVKTSDSLVVDLSVSELRVVDTESASLVGSLDLVDRPVAENVTISSYDSLLLDGTNAVVFGMEIVESEPIDEDPSAAQPLETYVTLTFVDLSDAATPTVVERIRVEGHLVAARRVGEQVRIVTGSDMSDLPLVAPATAASVPVALEQNRLAVAGSSVDDWIPAWNRGHGTEDQRLVDCDRVVVPDTFAGVQMTSLVAFDIAGSFEPMTTGILAPSDMISATAEDVVVTSHIWVDPSDQDESYEDWSSALHRFSFAGDFPEYVASGEVPGSIHESFSIAMMSDDSTLAVLTVDVFPWEQLDEAIVTVRTLTTEGAVLEPLATLEVAVGGKDRPRMRFIDDRLVVSSGPGGHRISVVDLSDPADPVGVGEVDIDGSGSYFHPLGEHRLLAVGAVYRLRDDANPLMPLTLDLSVSLLDISEAPRVVNMWRNPNSSAGVGGDHHRFTWWPQRSTAAFGESHSPPDAEQFAEAPDALLLGVHGDSLLPVFATPTDVDLGPKCTVATWHDQDCDSSGPPQVVRVLVVGGDPWLYTSESLERFEVNSGGPITSAAPAELVVLPPSDQ